jgi:glycosidase
MMRFGSEISSQERGLLERTRAITHLRLRHSALRYGDFLTLAADRSIYAFLRSDLRERLLVVLNKSEKAHVAEITLPKAVSARRVVDVESGEQWPVSGRRVSIPLDGIGWRVLRVES